MKPALPSRLRVGRVYEPAAPEDGQRVLVDRLWPRGLTRERARLDAWLKDLAPSDALRRRFHGQPALWDDFVADYAAELSAPGAADALAALRARLAAGVVTLLYASTDERRNNAVALRDWLLRG